MKENQPLEFKHEFSEKRSIVFTGGTPCRIFLWILILLFLTVAILLAQTEQLFNGLLIFFLLTILYFGVNP